MSLTPSRRAFIFGLAAASAFPVAACAESLSAGGRFIDVSGDRQWLLRTGPAAAPIVLVLHGGPGGSETLLFRRFNRALEARLQMVYWDQRGAGRSYDAERPPNNMTVAQFIRDLDVVVDYLRAGSDQPIFLLGHSWGSALGAIYTREYPEKIGGFIGVSQVADGAKQERASYDWCMSEANRRQNKTAIKALAGIGAPPFGFESLMVKNHWVEEFGGYFASGFDKFGLVVSALLRGQTSVGEVKRIIDANTFSLRALYPEVRTLDVTKRAPAFDRPTAFLLGRLDRQCPSDLSASYFEALSAPKKDLVWFERSAHNAPFEQPRAFNAAVLRLFSVWTT